MFILYSSELDSNNIYVTANVDNNKYRPLSISP